MTSPLLNPVQDAVRNGSPSSLKKALALHPEHARTIHPATGQTPLMDALMQRDNDRCIKMLLPFSDLRQTNRQGYSALMLGLCYGQSTRVIETLVPGSDLLQTSDQGETALSSALRNGADPGFILGTLLPGSDATRPGLLSLALQHDRTFQVAHALLVNDSSVRRFWDHDGRTALHHAVLGRHAVEHVREILSVSDPRQTDHEAQTALHTAVRFGAALDVVKLLIKSCNPNATDDQGYTPLLWAMMTGDQDVFETLLPVTDLERKHRGGRNVMDVIHHMGQPGMQARVVEHHRLQQAQALMDEGVKGSPPKLPRKGRRKP